ncbi:ABC transporter ATP-binding protein [Actinotignum urinale]|uniref:ABC transporter ATP-binding protein n=1 Tax=Actinotignum urinale TaxID=190146 RepID=UPI0003B68F93|nr:ABC transporter ATP-binding protein [Actinotignum urinale]MDY5159912.1 ABC transporter ATP-binding protein [Actinotignum urinale]
MAYTGVEHKLTGSNIRVNLGGNRIVRDINIQAGAGDIVGIIGPNGCGKSTLLRALYAALPADGTVCIDGQEIHTLSRKRIAQYISVVEQQDESPMPTTVRTLVALGLLPHGSFTRLTTEEDDQSVMDALDYVDCAHLADRFTSQLSGGEYQRVKIAKTIVQNTPYLFLDEPTNHLDLRYQHQLLNLVKNLQKTTLIVLHDVNLAARYCDRIVLINDGRIVAEGSPWELLTPEHLEPIYHMSITRIEREGLPYLFFDPQLTNQEMGKP